MAQLSKFTPERVKAILADIADHIPYKIAAESNGIADSTFYDWIYTGVGHFRDDIESDYTRMVESLRTIEKKKVKELVETVKKSGKGHKGAEWTLEHVFWKYFSSNAAIKEFDARLTKMEEKNSAKEVDSKGD